MSEVEVPKVSVKFTDDVRLRDIGLKIILSEDPSEKVEYTFAAYKIFIGKNEDFDILGSNFDQI